MRTEKFFNGIQSVYRIKYTNQASLLEVLQSIYDDVTIYNDSHIRELITTSPKGYIPFEEIAKLPIFTEFADNNPEILISTDEIAKCIHESSKKLFAENYQVRRLHPFVDNIKNKKILAVYIQKIPKGKSADDVCNFFENIVGTVYQIYYKKTERWAILMIDNFQALAMVASNLQFDGEKLFVKSPEQTLAIYGENQRLNSEYNIKNIYSNKTLWNQSQLHPSEWPYKKESLNERRFQSDGSDEIQEENYHKQYFEREMHHNNRGDREEMSHRIQELKQRIAAKNSLERIKKFDNSALLLLRESQPLRDQQMTE